MNIATPSDINQAFADAYNNNDLEAVLALYEDEATLGRLDGSEALGKDEIRTELRNLFNLGGVMMSKNAFSVIHGDIALLRADWVIETEKGGEPLSLSGGSSEVARRQADGSWRYVIDYPLGSVSS